MSDPALSSFGMDWPNPALFGRGSVVQLGGRLQGIGATRVLLVSDAGLEKAGLVDRVAGLLRDASLAVETYTGVSPNPREAEVEAIHTLWAAAGCDAIVALGGGSTIDAVKGACLRRFTDRSLDSLLDEGIREHPREPMRFVAVPTTSGTGSETTLGAVLKTPRRKMVLRSEYLRPALTVLDPELVVSLPPRATAATGLDVLMHALGVLTSNRPHPIGNMVGAEAMRRAAAHLPRAVEDGRDMEARSEMMLASYLAGHGITLSGLDAIHGLSTPVESLTDCIHADSLGVIFPHVMRFNMPVAARRYAWIARLIGAAGESTPERDAAEALVARLTALRDRLGMPDRLGALGVERRMVPELARQAGLSTATKGNARPLDTADASALYEAMI
ncbi:1,3-propanediol dehydrogenase (plasmid) [Roseomonas mucosa]|uniref:1,3-propanediol dehydrogenase n=1 Tax=Roseomonas mucosa TaxID=207340 RepID=A0A4Y1MS91_9PROT|nr:iron-containing alcohol dehydrogenase [Roseomonas mucosa]AWV20493.1 1,3-propanediol dehydrogenase [Roseomonas mucosa]MDT8275734.1 iron-containing alcohol dehydrogenase [Roseomonas mucosa]MDT8356157.1 iron-containing alcohol dehydrogenase [Roseomonas mucosa]MDU7523785.1 iron-containing alcohol dehydrogenase [Roseomonas mucosa]